MRRKSTTVLALAVAACAVLVVGCPHRTDTPGGAPTPSSTPPGPPPAPLAVDLTVTSTAFQANAAIPKKYTGDGEDVSPPLAWAGAPAGAKEIALVCDDPDAPSGTFTHWVIWGVPAATTKLPENVAKTDTVAALGAAKQGKNDAQKIGYFGPAPPAGKPHRYDFTVYALDKSIDLKPGATATELRGAMAGHILGVGSLRGKYGR